MLSHIFHIRNKLSYKLIHKSVKDFEYLAPYLPIHIRPNTYYYIPSSDTFFSCDPK